MTTRARLLVTLSVVGGLAIIGGIVLTLQASLGAVSAKTNELDAARTEQSVHAALASAMDNLVGMVTDNAYWTIAYEQVNKPQADVDWFHETWGTTAETGTNYDGVAILDPDMGVWWGHAKGMDFASTDRRIFSGRLAHDGIVLPDTDNAVAKGIVDFGGSFALVATERIRPAESESVVTDPSNRYLLMYKLIDDDLLAGLSSMFDIDGLAVHRTADRDVAGIDLLSPAGNRIGALSWQPRFPGEEAAAVVRPKVMSILAAVCLLVASFVAVLVYGLRRLSSAASQLQAALLTDALTGLPNRSALVARLEQALASPRRASTSLGLVDIDGFQEINDTYGHEVGDQLLVAVADRLRDAVPGNVFLARVGGDEFAFLGRSMLSDEPGLRIGSLILDDFNSQIDVDGRPIRISLGIGVASTSVGAPDVEEMLRRADVAITAAKAVGPNQAIVFHPDLDADRIRRSELEAELRLAIERDEFDVVYQPIVDAGGRQMHSVEALLRWPRRPAGPLAPDAFIPVTETSGLIHRIGLDVLARACTDWLDRPDVRVSVNVSPVQFHDPCFEDNVARVLKTTGFPGSRLDLEVTEGYLIDQPIRAKEAMANLRALGIGIALDDFGTGYTSIGYLREYRFDRIKIDKSLAGRIHVDAEAAVMVAGTVTIANGLGMKVTAEGVETEEQALLLCLAGCHHLQGYAFGRPAGIESPGLRKEMLLSA